MEENFILIHYVDYNGDTPKDRKPENFWAHGLKEARINARDFRRYEQDPLAPQHRPPTEEVDDAPLTNRKSLDCIQLLSLGQEDLPFSAKDVRSRIFTFGREVFDVLETNEQIDMALKRAGGELVVLRDMPKKVTRPNLKPAAKVATRRRAPRQIVRPGTLAKLVEQNGSSNGTHPLFKRSAQAAHP